MINIFYWILLIRAYLFEGSIRQFSLFVKYKESTPIEDPAMRERT